MELICTAVEQQKLVTRDYTDTKGQQQKFRSVGVVLRAGNDFLYCEGTHDLADYLEKYPLKTGEHYVARIVWRTSEYTTSTSEKRTKVEGRLMSIVLL